MHKFNILRRQVERMDKEKIDIIYFTEKYMNFKLNDWQKELLCRHEKGEKLYFHKPPQLGLRMVKDKIAKTMEKVYWIIR